MTSFINRRAGFTPTVLLIEKDADISEIIKIILTDAGFAVVTFSSCPDCETILEINPFSIVLDETIIGDCRESQLCRQIKQNSQTRALPLILLGTNFKVAEIAKSSGADDYLQKPVDIKELTDKVIRCSISKITGRELIDSRSCYV